MSEPDWAYKLVTSLTLPGTAVPPVNVFRETIAAALRKAKAEGMREAANIMAYVPHSRHEDGTWWPVSADLRAQADRIERGETDPIASITKSR